MAHSHRLTRSVIVACAALVAGMFGCKELTDPSEIHNTMSLTHTVPLFGLDSSRWMTFDDHLDAAGENPQFDAVKDKITQLSIGAPTVYAVGINDQHNPVFDIDTLIICIGSDTSMVLDTLTGPLDYQQSPDSNGLGSVRRVNALVSEYQANLLRHPPYDLKISTFVHFTHPVVSTVMWIEWPLVVSYLN